MEQIPAIPQKAPLLHRYVTAELFHPLFIWTRSHPCQADLATLQMNEEQDVVSDQSLESVEVDLDAPTLTWSFFGNTPQAPTEKRFKKDLVGEAASEVRKPGPLLRLPATPTKIAIDPRRLVQ